MPVSRTRWGRLAAACAVMVAVGFIYGWSVFSAPLEAEFQWGATTLSFTFTVLMWAFCAGGIVGARIAYRTSSRTAVRIAAVAVFASFALTALLLSESRPWVMYLAYGVIGGCGVGMAYSVTMGVALAWFPDRTGLASGILLLCYSFSTMLLSSIAALLFDVFGWRVAFVLLAAGIAGIIAALSAPLRAPSPTERDELARIAESRSRSARGKAAGREHGRKEMLRSPAFYLYACWMFLVCSVGLAITSTVNQLALSAGVGAAAAVGVVGLLSICNGCGRLAAGIVFDTIGLVPSMIVAALLHIAGCALAFAAIAAQSLPIIVAAAVIGGAGIGGTSVVGSGFVATRFGGAFYAENLSVLNLVLIPAALAGPFALSASMEHAESYEPGLAALAALAAASIVIAIALRTRDSRANAA